MMYSIRSPKWACLVLLTGLSKTFAGALPDVFWFPDESARFSDDSQLLAVAPGGSDLFTDYSQIEVQADPYAEVGSYDLYAGLDPSDLYAESDPYDLVASSDPFDSGFEFAQATQCYYGDVLRDQAVHQQPACPADAPQAACLVRQTAQGALFGVCKTSPSPNLPGTVTDLRE
jgi:hypothetical protein